ECTATRQRAVRPTTPSPGCRRCAHIFPIYICVVPGADQIAGIRGDALVGVVARQGMASFMRSTWSERDLGTTSPLPVTNGEVHAKRKRKCARTASASGSAPCGLGCSQVALAGR